VQPIFLIMGTPASGKSTVAKALMQRFERGLHIPVDDLRHLVVAGLSDMAFEIPPETFRQLRLARESACVMARMYSDDGFAVAIDDFWLGENPDENYNRKISRRITRILLLPNLETTLERVYARNPDEGSFKQTLETAIRSLQTGIEAHPKTGWLVIDSSHLSVDQTVDQILERCVKII
jgi:adenylylsulfate kinase-like enzyme